MVIALANALTAAGVNYQRSLHVTAVDKEQTAAMMAYVQLSLLHVPAVVHVGDSLSQEMREAWATPAHWLGLWSTRLKGKPGRAPAIELPKGQLPMFEEAR